MKYELAMVTLSRALNYFKARFFVGCGVMMPIVGASNLKSYYSIFSFDFFRS